MKHWRERAIWVVVSAVLAGFLAYGFWPQAIQVDTAIVARGSVLVTIDDDGETRIREKYSITAPVTGKLLRVKLREGDIVERNQTELMQILPADPSLLDARAEAESVARVQAAEAALEESEASLNRAKSAADLAKDQYERASKLHQSESISVAEYEEAEHRHRIAEAEWRSAEFRAKVKRYEKEQAQAALLNMSSAEDHGKATPMKILSPIDGCVLRLLHEDSSVVIVGTPILEIGDPRDMELQIDVLSSFAVAIQPGAKVFIDHWGGDRVLHGVVRVVEPSAFLKVSALGVEEKRVKVIADFVESWEERKALGDGFRIEARIVSRSSDAASLKVATGALFREKDAWHVYRIRNGRTERVLVTVGESNGQETEIRDGLDEQDIVVLHPSEKIVPGVRVIIGP